MSREHFTWYWNCEVEYGTEKVTELERSFSYRIRVFLLKRQLLSSAALKYWKQRIVKESLPSLSSLQSLQDAEQSIEYLSKASREQRRIHLQEPGWRWWIKRVHQIHREKCWEVAQQADSKGVLPTTRECMAAIFKVSTRQQATQSKRNLAENQSAPEKEATRLKAYAANQNRQSDVRLADRFLQRVARRRPDLNLLENFRFRRSTPTDGSRLNADNPRAIQTWLQHVNTVLLEDALLWKMGCTTKSVAVNFFLQFQLTKVEMAHAIPTPAAISSNGTASSGGPDSRRKILKMKASVKAS